MTEQGKTAVADRVTALEMENTHLRRELFEMRQMARLREPADSWERLFEGATRDACEYFRAINDQGIVNCEGCPAESSTDCTRMQLNDIVRRAKALAGAE